MDRISALKFSKEIQQHEFDKIIHDIIMGKSVFLREVYQVGKQLSILKCFVKCMTKFHYCKKK